MKRSNILLLTALVTIILLATILLAETDTEVFCESTQDCYDDIDIGSQCETGECRCSEETSTCFLTTETELNLQEVQQTVAQLQNISVNKTALKNLEDNLDLIQTQSATADQKITTLEESLVLVQQQLSELTSSIDAISAQFAEQAQAKEDLQKDVTSVATGLAGLQTNVDSTQKDLKTVEEDVAKIQTFKLIVTIVGLILISAGILLGLQFYLKTKKADPTLVQYVIKQAKQGKRFAQVQPVLLKAGWTDDDIKEAYREAMKSSPTGAGTSGSSAVGPSGMDSKKVILLAGFALFFVIGIILVLKGVTTGHAIFFKDGGELSAAMKENIEKNLENNPFYSKVKVFDLCVEVEDGENAASYRITKTKNGDKIKELAVNCDNTDKYGFAVKFKSWEAFDLVSNDLTCANIKTIHNKKLMYVVPSKFIEEGFTFDETADVTPYCAVLKECLTAAQIKEAGIDC